MAVVFKFDEKAQEQLRIFDVREKLTEEYVANCKGVKGTWQERNEQLQALRKEYIKSYLEISPDVVDLNLINFADTLFYEFDRSRCDVKILLDARKEVWKYILHVYTSGKMNDESLVNLMRFIGVERDFYDETMLVGGLGEDCIDNLSLFDAKIINRRFRHEHFMSNMRKVKDAFYGEGEFYSQIEEIFDKKAKDCFNSEGCKEYMADIMKKASEFVDDGKTLSSGIQKNISNVAALEVSRGKKRTYLNLTYQEEEKSYRRVSQSIADYRKRGAQYEREYETVTREYDPEYVAKHLPKELSLEKDNEGYYLTQQECAITTDDLKKMTSRYDKKQELEQ